MGYFGFISTLLKVDSPWGKMLRFLPEKWRYYNGPLQSGEIAGVLPGETVQGFGWSVPDSGMQVWQESRYIRLWERFLVDLDERDIKVIGLDASSGFRPPRRLAGKTVFPGICDGRALELLLFFNRFRTLLRSMETPPQKTKVLIIWEEGNLGLACARLVAREVRFLSLVHPNARYLERAAELIMAETGIATQIFTVPPDSVRSRIVIVCGPLHQYRLTRPSRHYQWFELFQKNPSLTVLNADLPITALCRQERLPLYPALAEAILRSSFDVNPGVWYGSELPLEHVVKMAELLREVGMKIAI